MNLFFNLLISGMLKIDNGKISVKSTNFLFFPTIYISILMEYFKSRNQKNYFYLINWVTGFYVVNNIINHFKLKNTDEKYKIGMDFAENMGIGLYKTHRYLAGKWTEFEIDDPFIHEKYSDIAVAGVMAGGGSLVHGAVCQGIEIACKLDGAEKCKFLVATEEELKNRGLYEKVLERYNLDEKILNFQRYIFGKYFNKVIDDKEFLSDVKKFFESV